MCDLQAKLIAWLDCELSSDEEADLDRHLKGWQECRGQLETYKKVSETFDVYCDAVMAGKRRRRVSRWVPVLATAVVAAVLMFLALPQRRVEPPPVLAPTLATASVPVPSPHTAEAAPRKSIRRRHAVPPVQQRP